MTNTRSFTTKQNGETDSIINGQRGYSYDSNILEDKEKKSNYFMREMEKSVLRIEKWE